MSGTPQPTPGGGTPALEISNGMVQLLAKYTGRGPTKARTTIGRDHVLVTLADTLTRGERSLVDAGFSDHVLDTRSKFQRAMRAEAIQMVEGLTGRTVIGFMSDNHLDPDLGAEVFVFAPDGNGAQVQEADSTVA
jgi:uncharacterized protein YbcI